MNSEPSRRWWLGAMYAAIGAIAFAGKAILAKLMYRHGVDATDVLFWRMVMAFPIFLAFAWWGGREQAKLDARTVGRLVALGFLGYYLASFLDFWGLEHVSAALERLILYLNPTMVLLLGVILLGKPVGRGQVLAMVISYAGVVVSFAHELSLSGPRTAWGTLLVFGSALSYALYLTGSGELVRHMKPLRLVGWASSMASLMCIIHGLLVKSPTALMSLPMPVYGLSLVNAIVCTAVPILLVMLGIERLGATKAAQVGMIGPVSTVLMAAWILDEPLTVWSLLGTALVLLGIAVLAKTRT